MFIPNIANSGFTIPTVCAKISTLHPRNPWDGDHGTAAPRSSKSPRVPEKRPTGPCEWRLFGLEKWGGSGGGVYP